MTVIHPVLTCHDAGQVAGGRTSWLVDNYFVPGPRRGAWMGSTVTWFHRTIEQYVAEVTRAGFRRHCCVGRRRPRQADTVTKRGFARLDPSAFAGFRFPPDVITLAVRWYLRFGLSCRDVEELLAERGIEWTT